MTEGPVEGGNFRFKNCNNTPDVPIYVRQLVISPDPIIMTGTKFSVNVSTSIDVNEEIGNDTIEVVSTYLFKEDSNFKSFKQITH